MRDHAEWIILAVLVLLSYLNNSVMGEDGERAALDRVRNSSGYLIKYHGHEARADEWKLLTVDI